MSSFRNQVIVNDHGQVVMPQSKSQNRLSSFFTGQRSKTLKVKPKSSKRNSYTFGATVSRTSSQESGNHSPTENHQPGCRKVRFAKDTTDATQSHHGISQPFRRIWDTVSRSNWTLPAGHPTNNTTRIPPNPPRDTAVSFAVTDHSHLHQPQFIITCAVENVPLIASWLNPGPEGRARHLMIKGPSDMWRNGDPRELKAMIDDGVACVQMMMQPVPVSDRFYIPEAYQHRR